MDSERLGQIRGRLEAATPGPWEICFAPGDGLSVGTDGEDLAFIHSGLEDAAFIANAPTDTADLLAEVERLQGEIARVAPFLALHGVGGYEFQP